MKGLRQASEDGTGRVFNWVKMMSSRGAGESCSEEVNPQPPSATVLPADSPVERRASLWWGAALLLLSGICGLVFQVSWFREFRLVFGASTAASSAVLAVFMGGLGLGNIILGSWVDRTRNPLRLYAVLELSVALTTALSPFLIDALHACYVSLGGQLTLGFVGATAVRLLISVIVLAIPTFLMGGTLPAAVRAVTVEEDRQRRGAAVLYGANTFGAVLGAFGSTFFVLQHLGTRNTLWLACLMNAVTGCLAFAISRQSILPRVQKAVPEAPHQRVANSVQAGAPPSSPAIIYTVAGTAGFSFFLMELVWYRMLGPILGGTTFTFGLILTVALIGIGFGAAAYSLIFSGRRQVASEGLALICVLEACCLLAPFMLGDEIAILAARLRALNVWHFPGEVGGWFVISAIVILPAAFFSGLQFPMVIALLGQGDQDIGRQVGLTFGWNTVGAICGSLAGGFGLLPLLSAPEVWRTVALLLTLQGLCLIDWNFRTSRWTTMKFCTLLMTVTAAAMSLGTGPTAVWRHSGIGAGRGISMKNLESDNSRRAWQNDVRRSIVWDADGVESSVAIHGEDSLAFLVNGKSDGNAVHDASTQIMLGLIGAALHPEPKRSFVVGLGTGETAGWLAEVPSMEHVDVIELEPAIEEMARRCHAVNHDVLAHPKIRLIINDAREVLLTSRDRYDLIVCEPSNPYRSGIANLFTQEFYRAGNERLNDGGMFVQWIQSYEIDERTMRIVFATFQSVFSHVEVWESQKNDLVLVGCNHRPECSATKIRRKLLAEPFASALVNAWQTTDLEGFCSRYVGGRDLIEHFIGKGDWVINTDDRNEIEYAFARSVGTNIPSPVLALRQASASLDDQRHPFDDGDVNWEAVTLDRNWFVLSDVGISAENPALNSIVERFVARDTAGMLSAWESNPARATCLKELTIIGLNYALLGSGNAELVAERLRPYKPIDADLIRGILAGKQKRAEVSSEILAAAFIQLRRDPWQSTPIRESALDIAIEVSQADPKCAARLLDALSEPFLVAVADESRRDCACMIAATGSPETAARFVETYEPHIPWSKRFLTFREQVYWSLGHRLARQADLDLQEFQRNAAVAKPN